MRRSSCLAILSFFLAFSVIVSAQSGNPPASPVPPPRAHQEPCWRQAGLDRSVMEQRRSIELEAHSQVKAVCENSSLTPPQKHQQIREIRQAAKQKSDALITADQRSALQSCQQARTEYRAEGAHHGGDPCGGHEADSGPVSAEPGGPAGKAGGSSPQAPENNKQN